MNPRQYTRETFNSDYLIKCLEYKNDEILNKKNRMFNL